MQFILGRLYNQETCRIVINEILVNYNPYCKDDKQVKLIYEIGIKIIKEFLIYNTIVDNNNFNIDWENKEQRKKKICIIW